MFYLIFLSFGLSNLMGIPSIANGELFTDAWAQVLTAVACDQGYGTWYGRVCFVPDIDSDPRGQTYGIWLLLHKAGLTTYGQTVVIAVVSIAILIATLSSLTANDSRFTLVYSLTAISPSIHFAIERANSDVIIVIGIILSAWLFSMNKISTKLLSQMVLGLMMALKIYPAIATLTALPFLERSPKRALVVLCAAATTALAIMTIGLEEIAMLGDHAPQGLTPFSSGFLFYLKKSQAIEFYVCIVAAIISISMGFLFSEDPEIRNDSRFQYIAFSISSIIFISLYAIKTSYDYRWVIMTPAIFFMITIVAKTKKAHGQWPKIPIIIISSFFISSWSLPFLDLDDSNKDRLAILIKQVAANVCVFGSLGVLLRFLWADLHSDCDKTRSNMIESGS